MGAGRLTEAGDLAPERVRNVRPFRIDEKLLDLAPARRHRSDDAPAAVGDEHDTRRIGQQRLEPRPEYARLHRLGDRGLEHLDVLAIRRARRAQLYFKNPS
jgi:hypothetical protein